ncbi:MAG TPA: hypothetical protein VGB07_36370 [Blastocatellia bacterium]
MSQELEPYEVIESEEPESLSETIAPLIPLAEAYLRNSNEQLKAQMEVTKMQSQQNFSIKAKELEAEVHKFDRLYLLLFVLILGLVGIAAGIIFALRDVQTGLLLISHLTALAVGVLGGLGLKKGLEREKKD